MKKLIEITQESVVVCDNPKCDFEIPYDPDNRIDLMHFINVACPKCGENLLTPEDYLRHEQLMRTVNFLNKWFSWITIFQSGKRETVSVYTHNKIEIRQS